MKIKLRDILNWMVFLVGVFGLGYALVAYLFEGIILTPFAIMGFLFASFGQSQIKNERKDALNS